MKKLAKILVLTLSVALVFGAIALVIGAETGPAYGYYTEVGAEISETDDLAEAFAGAYDGKVILRRNIEISESLVIPEGKTFDLGNKKITNTANVFVFSLEGAAEITGEGHIQTVGGIITSPAGASLSGKDSGIYVKSESDKMFDVASGELNIELCDIFSNNQGHGVDQFELHGAASLYMKNTKLVVHDPDAFVTKPADLTSYLFRPGKGDGSVAQTIQLDNCYVDSTTRFAGIGGKEHHLIVNNSIVDVRRCDDTSTIDYHDHGMYAGGIGKNTVGSLKFTNTVYRADVSVLYLYGAGSPANYEIEYNNCELYAEASVYGWFRGPFTVHLTNGTKCYSKAAPSSWTMDNTQVYLEEGIRFNIEPAANKSTGFIYPGENYAIYENYEPQDKTTTFKYAVAEKSTGGYYAGDYSGKSGSIDKPSTSGMANVNGYTTYSYILDGKTIGLKYHLPEFVSDNNGGYTFAEGTTGTHWSADGHPLPVYIPGENGADGQITLGSQGTYIGLKASALEISQPSEGGGIKKSSYKVITYKFGVYADPTYGMPDLVVMAYGKTSSNGSTESNLVTIKNNEAVVGSSKKAIEMGVVNCFEIVVDIASSKAYVYVNGEFIDTRSGGAINGANRLISNTLRCRIGAGTYNENASFSLVYSSGYAYESIIGESFNAEDYITYHDNDKVSATVNGIEQKTLGDALINAEKIGSVVYLTGDIAGEHILPHDVGGYIVTNGYSVSFSSNLAVSEYTDANGNTVYCIASPLDVNWNYDGQVINEKYELGEVPTAPTIDTTIDYIGGVLRVAGWAAIEINPADYADYDSYKAAADAVKLQSFAAISANEVNAKEAREYYAVYELIPAIAVVTGADGSVKYLETLSAFVMYMQDDYNDLMVSGDTVRLTSDVTVTTGIEGANGVQFNIKANKTITIDLNGHTVDLGTSGASFTIGAMNMVNGTKAYTHGSTLGLNVLSSKPGAKILSASNAAVFALNGGGKTFNYHGENIHVEAMRFFDGNAQGSSTADGRNTSINIDGGTFKQLAGSAHSFIRHNGNTIVFQATINISNASFTVAPGTTFLLRVDGEAKVYNEETITVRDAVVFTNCDITLESDYDAFLYSYQHNALRVVLNNCDLVGSPLPSGGYGKVVLGEGTTISSHAADVKAYDEAALANPELDKAYVGTYLGASNLAIARVDNNTWKIVNADEVVTYSFVEPDGTVLGTEGYIAGAAPYYAGKNHNEYKTLTLVFAGWKADENAENTYIAQYELGGKGISFEVSAFLYTELGVNLYIPADIAAYLVGGSDFVDAGDGYYRATVTVPSNLVFSGASFTLGFEEDTIIGKQSVSYSTSVSVVQYAAMILGGEFSAAEKDLMFYMLNYLDAAYKYVAISDAEQAAIESFGFETAADAFKAAIGDYAPTKEYAGEAIEREGESLGLNIAVDLQASPEYVIKVLDENIKSIKINGKLLSEVDGGYVYNVGNIYNFDNTLSVVCYDENGDIYKSGEFCYANYVFAANTQGGEIVSEIANDLYSYILAADAYKASLVIAE